jgi:hypothetical protein
MGSNDYNVHAFRIKNKWATACRCNPLFLWEVVSITHHATTRKTKKFYVIKTAIPSNIPLNYFVRSVSHII